MGRHRKRQVGAALPHIDITPEMIEAGASVLRWSGPVDRNSVDRVVEGLAGDIFRTSAQMSGKRARPALHNSFESIKQRLGSY